MHLLPVSSGKTVENPDETLGQVSGEGFLSRFSHPSLSGICAVALLLCTSLPAARGVAKHNKKIASSLLERDFFIVFCGERGIRILFFNILTPFHMCLIPPIIHFYNEILVYKICFSPSQSSHIILSVSPRCNFFIAKMHQKTPHLHPPKLLIVKIIIIISPIRLFPLERFFSISHFCYVVVFGQDA